MENKTTAVEDEEIDLRQIIGVLQKRKRLILGITFGTALAALVVCAVMPKIYRAEAVIEIGNLAVFSDAGCGSDQAAFNRGGCGWLPIESPLETKEKIDRDIYGAAAREIVDIAAVPTIKVTNTANTNILYLSLKSPDPEAAKNYLAAVCEGVLADHKKKSGSQKAVFENEISKIQQVLAELRAGANRFQTANNDYYSQTAELEHRLGQAQLSSAAVADTALIKQPSVAGPVEPRVALNVALAAVLGLFAGIFLALAANWWRKP